MEREICREQLLADIYNRLGITKEFSKELSQARVETNHAAPWGKMHEKGCLFPKDFGDLSAGCLKELCEDIERSFIVVCRPYTPRFQLGDEEGKNIHRSTTVGSCAANIDAGEERKTPVAPEVNTWQDQIALESETRRQAEEEVHQLKRGIQEAQKDNRKLERYIQEWKLMAEQARSSASQYRQRLRGIRTMLEELKSVIEIEESCCD